MAALDITRTPWIGNVNGTFVGNAFAEFKAGANGAVGVSLRVRISEVTTVLSGSTRVTDASMTARLTAKEPAEGDPPAHVDLLFTLLTQERIECRWEMSDGNAGTMQLMPAPLRLPAPDDPPQNGAVVPLQVIQSTRPLPKINMYQDDLKKLSVLMKTWLTTPFDVIYRAELEGHITSLVEPTFWEKPLQHRTSQITLWLSEPGPIPRSINISLTPNDCSFTVTGTEAVWVSGTLAQVNHYLGRKHGWWKTAYEKHALNINGIALLLAIALSPSLNLPSRILLLGMTTIFIIVIKLVHDRTTALKIYLDTDYKEIPYINLPNIMTAVASASLLGFVAWLYKILEGGALASITAWLSGPI